MKIRSHASQFSILLVAVDADWGTEAKAQLSQAGYDAHLILDYSQVQDRLKEKNPHVMVFAAPEVEGSLSAFVEAAVKFNPELKMVILAESGQFDRLLSYAPYGFDQFVTFQKEHIGARTVFAVDAVCEKIYLQYQNEQLLEDLKKKPVAPVAPAPAPVKDPGIDIAARVIEYQSAPSPTELIQKFFDFVNLKPLVYFRFLPSLMSFVATQAAGFKASEIQGVGAQIEGLAHRDLSTQVALGVVPAPLLEVVRKAFRIEVPSILPLYSQGNLDGVVVYSQNLEPHQKKLLEDEFALFRISFSQQDLTKKIENLEVQDPVTEIFNRKHFEAKLTEEFVRSARIKQALSMIKIAIDDFLEIEQTLGDAARDLLLKKIAQMVQKSSRTNDITARTGHNEISSLLPHCNRKGALIRAERIRRMVENAMTQESGMKVSVSIGISEYPTLCDNAQELEQSATKALTHIASRGGNKICLYKAPNDHRPKFEVFAEEG